MPQIKFVLLPAAFIVMSVVTASNTYAGPKSYVGTKTVQGPFVSMDRIDHAAWDALLKKYVDKDGFVNYRAWHASANDRQQLSSYLSTLSRASSKVPAKDVSKKAFWINAYNSVTISGILKEYPTSSIRNHTAKVIGYNIWKDYELYVGGEAYSLDTIENKILRKMSDPRIHFGIVCASIGCPRLLNQAYDPTCLSEQLEINAKDFFSRSQNFKYDASRNQFQLSSILDWFGGDFGKNQAAELQTIAQWLPTPEAMQAATRGGVSVSFQDYNWNLNEQK